MISKKHLKKLEKNENAKKRKNSISIKRLIHCNHYVEDYKFSLKILEQIKSNRVKASKFYEDLVNSVNNFSNTVIEDVHTVKSEHTKLNI